MSKFPPVVTEKAYRAIAECLEKSGLKLEENFRTSDQGMALTYAAVAAMRSTGFPDHVPGNDSISGMGFPRDGSFWHPLSQAFDDGNCNLWASASLLVNTAMGWLECEDVSRPATIVAACISRCSPTTSVDELMHSSRYSDAALMKLTGLVRDGLQANFETATGR